MDDLYQYFTSKDGYTQLDKYIYSFLQEEYLKEQNRTDSLTIENIRSKRYNSDDEFFDKNLINDDQNGVFTEKMESQKYNLGSNHLDENFLVDKFLEDSYLQEDEDIRHRALSIKWHFYKNCIRMWEIWAN